MGIQVRVTFGVEVVQQTGQPPLVDILPHLLGDRPQYRFGGQAVIDQVPTMQVLAYQFISFFSGNAVIRHASLSYADCQ
jgi:hypothetical protein